MTDTPPEIPAQPEGMMATKTEKKLTDSQQQVLSSMSTEEFRFPPKGKTRSCESLESSGLLEGKLMLAKRDFAKGTGEFRRAYRKVR